MVDYWEVSQEHRGLTREERYRALRRVGFDVDGKLAEEASWYSNFMQEVASRAEFERAYRRAATISMNEKLGLTAARKAAAQKMVLSCRRL